MGFSYWANNKAGHRQDRKDGRGTLCAKCCIDIIVPYAIPRVPIDKGGDWKTENCVVLCYKCYLEIGDNHPEVIPHSELPCFKI